MENSFAVTSRIREYVKDYLKTNGIKQRHLASQMGYDEKKFSRLINGKSPLPLDDFAVFCTYFNIPATTFIPFNPDNEAS